MEAGIRISRTVTLRSVRAASLSDDPPWELAAEGWPGAILTT